MKIDCPHCGVAGSIDDSLANKKLRCPKCNKVFLVPEEILPENDDIEVVGQETLSDDENSLETCSACGQLFASEFLVEVDSDFYCALCQPESEEEHLGLLEEETDAEDLEEETLEITEENTFIVDSGGTSTEDDELLALMGDEINGEDDEDLEIVLEEEQGGDPDEQEICSGCGESLHPDFLETVGFLRYCALCAPEELADEETEDISIMLEEEKESSQVPCSVCGEKLHPDFMLEVDSKLYCGICQPEMIEAGTDDNMIMAAAGAGTAAVVGVAAAGEGEGEDETDAEASTGSTDFTVGELIKEAWQKTKGAKASIWGAVLFLYAVIFGVSLGGVVAFPEFYKGGDPTVAIYVNGGLQLITSWLSMLMTGGIMLIGVRHVLKQRVSWKMVFAGFSKVLSITIAVVLQTILIGIGFVLLVIPGVYLSVGYALTLPLILEKGMGPWEALETSRKAIHKKWWTVFGLYLVMILLFVVSVIPLGLGLIWTVPMCFVLIGVLYIHLFGSDGNGAKDPEDELADEVEETEESEEISEEIEQKHN
ncbi:MAG: hypothetical protein JKY62_14510 [Desulfocapsa sp.]|nr:hypothetical protein [Desulfocapsa sp.]MBN4060045.1 hypothetical protein [Desulfotalea psychrophila]